MEKFNPIIEVNDDGLYLPKPVGPWAERKYNLVGGYSSIFNIGIKNKFQHRVFIDANKHVNEAIKLVQKLGQSSISFCFVDPFSLNLHFSTIERLSTLGRIDFLILLALPMDANRNFIYYNDEENKKVDLFLARNNWREPFKSLEVSRQDFIKFLADVYDDNMLRLGYKVKNEGLKPRVDADE